VLIFRYLFGNLIDTDHRSSTAGCWRVREEDNQQASLFVEARTPPHATLGRQADIVYLERRARSVLNSPENTGMPYWSLNPYVGCAFGCAYCYARYAHRYMREREDGVVGDPDVDAAPTADVATEMPPWLAFERRIYVKRHADELVRAALGRAGVGPAGRNSRLLRGEPLVVGTATDPYQPAERHFRVTRGVLEALAAYTGLRIVLITKSALVTRDIDVLTQLATRSRLTVHLSLITLDRDLARRIEPRAPTPEARLRALGRLRAAGVDVGINVMPILPGITDHPEGLEALVARVAADGATHVNAGALRLQAEARRRYLPFIESEFPHLAARYRATYGHGYDIGERYQAGLVQVIRKLCMRYGVRYGRFDQDRQREATAAPATREAEQLEVEL
jgi:DNA repair photolyase